MQHSSKLALAGFSEAKRWQTVLFTPPISLRAACLAHSPQLKGAVSNRQLQVAYFKGMGCFYGISRQTPNGQYWGVGVKGAINSDSYMTGTKQ